MMKKWTGKVTLVPFVLSLALLCMPVAAYAHACFAVTPATVRADGLFTIEDNTVPLASGTAVLVPQSSGTTVYTGGGVTLDASNASEGYVMIKYDGNNQKIKVQITRSGGITYSYDLNARGSYEVFPFTDGNGTYQIGVYTNVSGDSYAQALAKNVEVSLRDGFLPFLYPSQYVNFSSSSTTVAVGQQLAATAQDELTVIQNIYNYVTGNISYDTYKAQVVQSGNLSGYLPAVDEIIASGKGICFDYAAVMTAMLRSQQIPTRMEVGYVSGGQYHAWISTYIQEVGWVNGIIQFDGQTWRLMDPTFASAGGDAWVQQYIGNGGVYSTQYVY